MKFTEEMLQKIIRIGSYGFSLSRIAGELNMTPDQLRDEREINEKLNDALSRAEFNANQYLLSKFENHFLSGNKISQVEKDLYIFLLIKALAKK